MGDYFKTLREPLIEQQKKTDEKQDEVIEQLRDGFKDLVETNQDIIALNREVPQIFPPPPPERDVINLHPDNFFNATDKTTFEEYGLPSGEELMRSDEEKLLKWREENI